MQPQEKLLRVPFAGDLLLAATQKPQGDAPQYQCHNRGHNHGFPQTRCLGPAQPLNRLSLIGPTHHFSLLQESSEN